MNLDKIEELATAAINQHLTGWSFAWHRMIKAYGTCSYNSKTIYLSKVLSPTRTVEELKETITHEIAHALCPGHGHDAIWAAKSLSLGGNGKRCGTGGTQPPYTWVMQYEGKVVKGYFRKPTVALRRISTTFLVGREAETIGKLEIHKVA